MRGSARIYQHGFRRLVIFAAAISAATLAMALVPSIAHAEGPSEQHHGLKASSIETAAASYSYSVTPLLAPFNGFVYVKTDNPNPYGFRLVDRSSKYFNSTNPPSGRGIYHLMENNYLDVVYENTKTHRVKGGYIFCNRAYDSDGGELVVQVATSKNPARITENNGWPSYPSDMETGWTDTATKVSCATLKTDTDYLIDSFTNESMGFFDKMDAIESGLMRQAHYPRKVLDDTKPIEGRAYPFFATSPYVELNFNKHLDIYETDKNGLLLIAAYPYILDSASYPNMMSDVAMQLEPNCTISGVSGAHWLRKVTFNGESKRYGSGTPHGNEPILAKRATRDFRFDGSDNDFGTNRSIAEFSERYVEYGKLAKADADELSALISKDNVMKAIASGSWVQVAAEGWLGYSTTFGYLAPNGSGTDYSIASNAWVDGRYVNEYERVELGETFSEHPTADIIVRNQSYADVHGKDRVSDIYYRYNKNSDTWRASEYYTRGGTLSQSASLPEQFVLTRKQVKAMGVDANTNRIPVEGVVFDGTKAPGTPFTNIPVTGLSLPDKEISIEIDSSKTLMANISPANATDKRINLTSSDESIVSVNGNAIRGNRVGKATVTATTTNGAFIAECTVTVRKIDISAAKITGLSSEVYTGKPQKPQPTVMIGDTELEADTDYAISYKNNVNAGKATVTIVGKGNYTGSKQARFTVKKCRNALAVKQLYYAMYVNTSGRDTKAPLSRMFKVMKKESRIKVSYKLASTSRLARGKVKVSANGKITVKKTIAKGRHNVKVRVISKATGNYAAARKTVSFVVWVL